MQERRKVRVAIVKNAGGEKNAESGANRACRSFINAVIQFSPLGIKHIISPCTYIYSLYILYNMVLQNRRANADAGFSCGK